MEKKNIIKILLVSLAIVGLLYLIIDQFKKVGTTSGDIDYYDLSAELKAQADSLSTSWNKTSYSAFRSMLSDIDIALAMNGIEESSSSVVQAKTGQVFSESAGTYFKKSKWIDSDLSQIKHIANYLQNKTILNYIDGFYGARSIIAASKSCSSTSAVENCISKADSYNKAPWTNCVEIKDGLAQVKKNALDSYTNRSLLPLCNKLINYRTNYTYFDEFEKDYENVKTGKAFLDGKSYSNSSFNSKYASINYNNAANDLDPRF